MDEPLTEPYLLEYTYHRSTGPIVGRFLGGLVDGRILGARTASGRVIVPAVEWDPETGESTVDFVEVSQTGTVVGYTWVATPREAHLSQTPFAFLLVKLDGADTAMLHLGAFPERAALRQGTRVRAQFAVTRTGSISDIKAFVPVEEAS